MNSNFCPLSVKDFDQIRQALLDMPLQDLIFQTELIMDELTPVEKLTYHINHFCNDFSDKNGRINFIKALFDANIIGALQIPFFYQHNPQLQKLLRKKRYTFHLSPPPGAHQEEAALTDDIEMITGKVQVTNSRWEHVDEGKAQSSPDKATVGETIALLVDVTGIPEGASVTFDIFDVSQEPPMRIDTVKGTNSSGTARGTWIIQDPNEQGETLRLQFEGIAKSKASDRKEILLIAHQTWGICQTADGEVVPNCAFQVWRLDAIVHRGETDADGCIKVPFEYSDKYTVDFFEMESA